MPDYEILISISALGNFILLVWVQGVHMYMSLWLFYLLLQLQIWKRLIAWEKSNPTRTEDQAVLVKRGEPPSPLSLFCSRDQVAISHRYY